MRAAICCTFLLLMAGCALNPSTEDAKEFGAAATTISTIYSDVASAESDMITEASRDQAVCRFLNGGNVELPIKKIRSPDENLQAQSKFLLEVAAYSKALSEATDPAGVAKLEAAADGFSASTAELATAAATAGGAAAPSELPVVKPMVGMLTFIGVNAAEFEYRRRIRDAARKAENPLLAGIVKLVADAEKDKVILRRARAEWVRNRTCVLAAIRQQDRDAAAQRYYEANLLALDYDRRIALLNKIGEALNGLHVAHAALVDGNDADLKRTLTAIKKISSDLQTISKVI